MCSNVTIEDREGNKYSGLWWDYSIAVFMPRVKGHAALIGFITGEIIVFLMSNYTTASLFLYGATGMIVSIIIAYLTSFINKK